MKRKNLFTGSSFFNFSLLSRPLHILPSSPGAAGISAERNRKKKKRSAKIALETVDPNQVLHYQQTTDTPSTVALATGPRGELLEGVKNRCSLSTVHCPLFTVT